MADYKRMVSYMYQYENGVKKKNVGFARVEAKDGQCKITLHMQLLGQLDSIFPTYILQRKHGELELIYLGDTMLKNQVMDSKLTADESNIMNSGYPLSDMGGLLLFLHDNIFFATEWDDKPILIEEVLEAMKPKTKPEIRIEAETETKLTLEEELLIPKYKLPRGYKTIERLQRPGDYLRVSYPKSVASAESVEAMHQIEAEVPEEEPFEEEGSAAIIEEETEGSFVREEQAGMEQEDSLNVDAKSSYVEVADIESKNVDTEEDTFGAQAYTEGRTEDRGEQREDEEEADPQVVKNIFEKYPRIYPFEDNEILLCAKIEPKDIGLLPKELWALSNNSFLVHGYYCYHHLIFAKMKDRYGCRYILGIPGIYHNREKFMAKMFGFDGFKPIRKRELRQGDFGYWYTTVSF